MGYELTKGTKLNNRYVIECTLGSGGFGTTYKAMDTLIDVPVAIKEYENSSEKDRKVAQREVKMAARFYALDGIASARDFFVVDSISYIVMEYVEGESLKKYVRNYGTMKGALIYAKVSFEGEDILTKLKPVIESLCVIHKEGIIHRDISPDNLMVTKGGSIQLIDFGEARNFEEQRNKELTLVYKRGYAPIEQCRQRGKQGAFTDVYSLCATIYFAVTGIDPDDSVERMIADHMKPLHEFYGTGLSDHEIHVIERGLSVDAKDRFQTMDELFEMLYEKKDLSEFSTDADKQNTTYHPFNTAHIMREIDTFYDKKKERKKGRTASKIFIAGLIAVLLVVVISVFQNKSEINKRPVVAAPQTTMPATSVPTPTATPYTVTIENYVGLEKKAAVENLKKLKDEGLTVRFQTKYSKKAKGTVIAQSIPAGKTYSDVSKKTLRLTISKGKKKIVATPRPTVTPKPVPKKKKSKVKFNGDLDSLS